MKKLTIICVLTLVLVLITSYALSQDSDSDGIADDEDNCPCHPNGPVLGTCVKNVGGVMMSYGEEGSFIPCADNTVCTATDGTCQKEQGDYNVNGIGDACECYANFISDGNINSADLLDLQQSQCFGKLILYNPGCQGYDLNGDGRVSTWDYIILKLHYGRDDCETCGAGIPPAPVPKTGQTISYATGDDGDLEKGVAWPVPRFTNNGDGTVTDNLTGLMWLKDANCIATNYPGFDNDGTAGDGRVTWQHALDFVAGINAGTYSTCGGGYSDWRLPNIKELQSLIDFGQFHPALPSGHPFTNVQQFINYWSSTTTASFTGSTWDLVMSTGAMSAIDKSDDVYVWPIRGDTSGPAPVPKTGQTKCYDSSGDEIPCPSTGEDGEYQKGVAWPEPRFTDHEDGTVTDNLTGLMWTKDAQQISGTKTWSDALTACNNLDFASYTDWRLPNVRELKSLIDYGRYIPALPSEHYFTNVQSEIYWSSTTYASFTSGAWIVYMGIGLVRYDDFKSSLYYVWPVRGGH